MGLDEDNQKIMSDLKRKRGVVKASLTRVQTFINKFNPREDSIALLEFRQEELPMINRKFDEIQCQIELIDVDNLEEAESERDAFETNYFAIRAEMQEIINAEKGHSTSMNNTSLNASTANSQRVRLPPISLPSFDGNIQDWESFYDCFRAMVHEDNGLSAAQKFYYLRSSLTGAALSIVKAVPMTDVNYEVAINRLKQRYANPGLIIQSHIRSLLETPHIKQPTSSELQGLHAHICAHVAALKAMNQPTLQWDAWLVTIIVSRLDPVTSHDWQLRQTSTDLPKYEDLERFLANRCIALENSDCVAQVEYEAVNQQYNSRKRTQEQKIKNTLLVSNSPEAINCPKCKGKHKIYACEEFKKLSPSDRLNVVREAKLCFNCLSDNHLSSVCKSKYSCSRCNRRHNTLLHINERGNNNDNNSTRDIQNGKASTPSTSQTQSISMSATVLSSHVFLATAVVMITDNKGKAHKFRAVLDSGSQLNFVSKHLQNTLRLPGKKTILSVCGVGKSQLQTTSKVDIQVLSHTSSFKINLSCQVLPSIVNDLSACVKPEGGWKIENELISQLADPLFDKAGPVDLLIGAEIFFEIMEPERIPLEIGNLSLQKTKLGWIVTGKIEATCLINIEETPEINSKVVKDSEQLTYNRLTKGNQRCVEDEQALRHFQEHTYRNKEGRFTVRLPIKSSTDTLGNSLYMATTRFLSVERRLQRDEKLKIEYTKFMNEYLEKGHMQEVQDEERVPRRSFYLPHHTVQKESSITTKTRVVFDASAKSSSGVSLNDILMYGPTVQADIFTILARFRKHQYVLMADVEKMFRQVAVDQKDWNLQRIVWRDEPTKPLRTFKLTTITYGMKPASFLATQCLVTLANTSQHEYPRAAEAIRNDMYMDDLMTGAETEEDCIRLQQELNNILNSVKFPLRKWCSNSVKVIQCTKKGVTDPLFTLEIKDGDTVKSLGLQWRPFQDEFHFNISMSSVNSKCTKRTLLSDLNRIFDPLGFLAPALLKGKIFMQQVWALKVDWDCPLSTDIKTRWEAFIKDLEILKNLYVPRKVIPYTSNVIEFHGFSDASEEAYGACLYVRTRDNNGMHHTRLLCAKTRVAPLKGSTIPRLELNGALLLTEIAKRMSEAWSIDVHSFQLWTDSTVVLGWLNNHGKRLKTYVSNRVNQILEITCAQQWKHVRTNENPADMASRGIKPSQLLNNTFWWNGPEWLVKDDQQWIISGIPEKEENLPETKEVRFALMLFEPTRDLLQQYSSWTKLIRATAWLSKFIVYLRTKKMSPEKRYLTAVDLKNAETILLKRMQRDEFSKELLALEGGNELNRGSRLKSLNPFLYDGIIKVGGRLNKANLTEQQRHPIVLAAKHRVTRLLFENYHIKLLHCGPQLLIANIREKYWPLSGRVMARSVVRKCIKCVKTRPHFEYPLMADLPKDRVQESLPFIITGVDFAGPIMIRSGIKRVVAKKAWIAVFVCFTTRAIHLEPVEELTSAAFLATLRCFIARRGKVAKIYSDNATNFTGAQRELANIISKAGNQFANEGIEWHFIPPASPHFGGLWESAVKSTKHHLRRVIGEHKLSASELRTLLCQIEACVNSRPLTTMSNEPDELRALTPAHFLIGRPINLTPEPITIEENTGMLKRWKLVQQLHQIFWRRWNKEYLPQLQIRGKWTNKTNPLVEGDVVIIKDECKAPAMWKLGKVIKVHPGSDGVIRVVTLKTESKAEVKRPVVKLCRLPIETVNE